MPVDTALIGALCVKYLEGRSLRMSEHSHHTLFQTSTIETLFGGNYEGDVALAGLDRADKRVGVRWQLEFRRRLRLQGRV